MHFLPGTTLDNCEALEVWLEVPAPRSEAVVVCRDTKTGARPDPQKPIRELQAGAVVLVGGVRRTVVGVEVFR